MRLPATWLAVRHALAEVRRWLRETGPEGADLGTIELVLAEALNNVVEHAYEKGTGPIDLRVERRGQMLHCLVCDLGAGLPQGCVPDPPCPDPETLAEGGYGWYLIQSLARNHRLSFRNALRFDLPLVRAEEEVESRASA
jgi:serine/threonine-protein kinase RsbW